MQVTRWDFTVTSATKNSVTVCDAHFIQKDYHPVVCIICNHDLSSALLPWYYRYSLWYYQMSLFRATPCAYITALAPRFQNKSISKTKNDPRSVYESILLWRSRCRIIFQHFEWLRPLTYAMPFKWNKTEATFKQKWCNIPATKAILCPTCVYLRWLKQWRHNAATLFVSSTNPASGCSVMFNTGAVIYKRWNDTVNMFCGGWPHLCLDGWLL